MFKKIKKEKGQALVEMALVLPILIIILSGIIDFGWIFYNQLALSNSCREGARFAVCNTSIGETSTVQRDGDIKDKIKSVTPLIQLQDKDITIIYQYNDYAASPSPLDGDVTIRLETDAKVLTPIAGVFYGKTKEITAKVTMKVES